MKQKKQYNNSSLDRLQQLIGALPTLERLKKETEDDLRTHPEKLHKILTPGFYWAEAYEFPFEEHLALAMFVANLVPEFQATAQIHYPQLLALDSTHDLLPDWKSGSTGQFELKHLFGLLISVSKNLESLMIYGCYLNDLVADVRAGRDKSLFAAVRIDRSIVNAPTIADRISKAEIDSDERFFKKLRNALKGKSRKQWAVYDHLRHTFKMLHESGNFDKLSRQELERILVKKLNLCIDQGKNVKELRSRATDENKKSIA